MCYRMKELTKAQVNNAEKETSICRHLVIRHVMQNRHDQPNAHATQHHTLLHRHKTRLLLRAGPQFSSVFHFCCVLKNGNRAELRNRKIWSERKHKTMMATAAADSNDTHTGPSYRQKRSGSISVNKLMESRGSRRLPAFMLTLINLCGRYDLYFCYGTMFGMVSFCLGFTGPFVLLHLGNRNSCRTGRNKWQSE